MKKRLGEILIERGLIDAVQLKSALEHQRQWGSRLGTALVAKGVIAEGTLTRVLAETLGIPMVDLSRINVDLRALHAVPRKTAEHYEVFPILLREEANGRRVLLLAMADPLNATAIDEIAFTTDSLVKPAIAQISSLEQAIKKHYYGHRVDVAPLASEAVQPDIGVMTLMHGKDERVVDTRPLETPPEFRGHPSGAFAMPMLSSEGVAVELSDVVSVARATDVEAVEAMEKKFWALMRVLARRGLLTKEEFLNELRQTEE